MRREGIEMILGSTYTSQPQVAYRTNTSQRIEKEIGRFNVSMNDASGMDVAKSAKKASHIVFDAIHRQLMNETLNHDSVSKC